MKTAAAALFALLIAIFPFESSEGAREALLLCANSLIPSLFPFMVCANLLTSYGAANFLSLRMRGVMKPVFGVSGAGALPLVMGLISGYPCGCATVCSLYDSKSITKKEAVRLSAYTNNSGPLFIIGAVGIGMYGSSRAGNILYLSHILSALTCGIILGLFGREHQDASDVLYVKNSQPSEAIYKAVISVLTLCGYVVLFSVGLAILDKLNIIEFFCRFLCMLGIEPSSARLLSTGILEITSGIFSSDSENLPLVSALISSGGISVFMQTRSILRQSGLPVMPYIFGKLACSVLAFFYATLILRFFPVSVSVFSELVRSKIVSYSCYSAAVLAAFAHFAIIAHFIHIRNKKRENKKNCLPNK